MIDLAYERQTSHEQARAQKVQRLGEAGIRSSGPLDPESGAIRAAEQHQEAGDLDPITDLPPVGGYEENHTQNSDGGSEPAEHTTQAKPSPLALPRGRQRRQPLRRAPFTHPRARPGRRRLSRRLAKGHLTA